MSNSPLPLIETRNLRKSFRVGDETIPVLKGIDLSVYNNDFLVVVGPSGCGKSTLLHVILGLEPPTSGTVSLFGVDLYAQTSEDDRAVLRRSDIGIVFQQPNWIRALSVIDNVAFPLWMKGVDKKTAHALGLKRLDEVGMLAYADRNPFELSNGQQQRIAVARALAIRPNIIIADEPTGNLDRNSGVELMRLLKNLHDKDNKTIIIVTHAVEYISYGDRVVQMLDGKITREYTGKEITELQSKLNAVLA